MIKIGLIILLFFTQCSNETIFNDLKWRTVVAKEADVKVDFPCEPKKTLRHFRKNRVQLIIMALVVRLME